MSTKKITPAQMAKRNARIVKLGTSGKHTIKSIAEQVGLSKTRVAEIIKSSTVTPSL